MTHFAIAGIQMQVEQQDNIGAMEQRLQQTMDMYPWVQMVLFSELAPFGSGRQYAEPRPGPAEERFQAMAASYGIWLIPGSLYQIVDDKLYNTSPVINPAGQIITRYEKMFPFYPYEEGISPGSAFCVFDVDGVGRFGVSNCYDIWFPETTRTLAAMGAEVLLHPVMTSYIDRDIDLVMARAAAASNQCYVFDINGVSAGGVGKSCVFDPAARVIHQAGSHEEIIPVEIDLEQVRRQRVRGIRTLGQPLKSWRDNLVPLEIYRDDYDHSYLESLGPLVKPHRQDSSVGE
ncbi:MAG: carbon-nitrogen hydrolase family protein [Gammaproteobacteria bacterium]|nr:carbon-nitrogen hydrolase family protein [Gammaproteobacteria bacterium]